MGRGNTIVILFSIANSTGKLSKKKKKQVYQLFSVTNGNIGEGIGQGKRDQNLSLEASLN